MTNDKPDLASFERIRAELEARYRKLKEDRVSIAVEGTRCIEACKVLPAEQRPVDESVTGLLNRLVDKIVDIVDGLYQDIWFPTNAAHDSLQWANIDGAADRTATIITKIEEHGANYSDYTSGVSQDLTDDRPRYSVVKYPWDGLAGNNYRSQIPRQRAAALRIQAIAMRAGAATNTMATYGIYMYFGLVALLVTIGYSLWILRKIFWVIRKAVSAYTAFRTSAYGWILTDVPFLRWAAMMVRRFIQAILSATIGYLATLKAASIAGNYQAQILRNLLTNDAGGKVYTTVAFAPHGTWPNPTSHPQFPHVVKQKDGTWKVQTSMPTESATFGEPPTKSDGTGTR